MNKAALIPTSTLARMTVVVALVLGFFWALFYFRLLVLASLIGVMGGVLLVPWIEWVRRCARLPQAVATAAVLAGLLGVVGGGVYAVWVLVAGQAGKLVEQGPAIVQKSVEAARGFLERVPGGGFELQKLDLGAALRRAGEGVVNALHIGVEGLAGLFVMLMIAVFVATNAESYLRGALSLLPPRARPRGRELAEGSARVIRRWFSGQLLVMTITSAMAVVALGALGVDYWLVIGFLTGFLDFVPFFGAFITGALAVGVTLGTQPEKAGWVLLVYIAIQQVESNVVAPLVMKGRIQLPEAHLLVFVLLMGLAFGILGVFAAPPVFGVLHHLYDELYLPWVEGRRGRSPARWHEGTAGHAAGSGAETG